MPRLLKTFPSEIDVEANSLGVGWDESHAGPENAILGKPDVAVLCHAKRECHAVLNLLHSTNGLFLVIEKQTREIAMIASAEEATKYLQREQFDIIVIGIDDLFKPGLKHVINV